jgi:hypothetical protein
MGMSKSKNGHESLVMFALFKVISLKWINLIPNPSKLYGALQQLDGLGRSATERDCIQIRFWLQCCAGLTPRPLVYWEVSYLARKETCHQQKKQRAQRISIFSLFKSHTSFTSRILSNEQFRLFSSIPPGRQWTAVNNMALALSLEIPNCFSKISRTFISITRGVSSSYMHFRIYYFIILRGIGD